MRRTLLSVLFFVFALPIAGFLPQGQTPQMGFFITSAGPGKGADLGGLAGADAHCQTLAAAAGAGGRTWRAYLSTAAGGTQPAVNARDRIGAGPWYNAKGVTSRRAWPICTATNKLSKENSLTEKGETGQRPRRHAEPPRHPHRLHLDGTASTETTDTTCTNWTSSGEGSAHVGHHDRQGGGANPTSWNASHPSRGCSQANLRGTGGDGLFYCFAAK